MLGGNVTFTGLFGVGGFNGMIRVNAPHVMTWTGTLSAPSLNVVGSGTGVIAGAGHFLPDLRIGVTPLTNTAAGPTTVRPGTAARTEFDLTVHTGSTFSPTWFLAEGATGAGFDTFVLVANPNVDPVDVTYTLLPASANPATITRTIAGLSRHTLNIEAEGLSLPDGPVGDADRCTGTPTTRCGGRDERHGDAPAMSSAPP